MRRTVNFDRHQTPALVARMWRAALLGIVATALASLAACTAPPERQPADVPALASQYGLEEKDLADYLEGYDRGYSDGIAQGAGMSAGATLGDVPGPEGFGWRLGRDDALNGRPMREPSECAQHLAERGR